MENSFKLKVLELAFGKQYDVVAKKRRKIEEAEQTTREDNTYKKIFLDGERKSYEKECETLRKIDDYLKVYYAIEYLVGFAIFTCPQKPDECGEFVTTFLTFEEAEEYVENAKKAGYMYFIKGIDRFGKFVMIL